jgi:hypothetical protein
MRKVKKYTRENLLRIFIEMFKRCACVLSVTRICPNQEIISSAYNGVVLLQTKERPPYFLNTLFQLGKNNLDRFGHLSVASNTDKCPDANLVLHI